MGCGSGGTVWYPGSADWRLRCVKEDGVSEVFSQNRKNPWYKTAIKYATICTILVVILIYWNYIKTAESTVPIMDFWHWIAIYGQKVVEGTIHFKDFFFSDRGEHIQPLLMAIQFDVLRYSKFDVKPLVEMGAVLRIVMALFLVAVFITSNKKRNNEIFQGITVICLILCVLNFNQWELMTEPFALGNSLRVFLYYLSFMIPGFLAANIKKWSAQKRTGVAVVFGSSSAAITVLFSAAYFVAFLPAIGLSFMYLLIRDRDKCKDYVFSVLIWGVLSFIGAITYLLLFMNGSRDSVVTMIDISKLPFHLLESIVLFFGASVLPNHLSDVVGFAPFYIVGTLLLLYIGILLSSYFGDKKDQYSIFPLTCIIYSTVIAVAISLGRMDEFGTTVMCSSRYAVESSIGLVGVTILTYEKYICHSVCIKSVVKGIMLELVLLTMLCSSMVSELQIAPYRGLYSENIAEIMRNIDLYSDEELSVTQGEAGDVRYCVEFFKENKLSIFQ